MPIPFQDPCQSRKTAENCRETASVGDFTNQELGRFAKCAVGTFTTRRASNPPQLLERSSGVFGKLAGAWLGEKVAGPNRGAKGAIIGYGAAALARRSVPALAAIAIGGWAFRKWRDRRDRRSPSYPSDESLTPSSD
jgi:hypothetical protein